MSNIVSKTIPDEYFNCCVQIESGGNPRSKAKTSSATGLGQFLNATWLGTVKKHRPDVMQGKSQAEVLAMRYDPSFSIEMLGRFSEDNQRIVGMKATFGDLYLAHFLGAATARAVFNAPQNMLVSRVVSKEAINANQTVMNATKTTCADLRAWANKRVKQSGGHDYVAKFYKPNAPADTSAPPPVPSPNEDQLRPGGDVQLQEMQTQLKAMKYYVGLLDGIWGGKTSEAFSGFLNDYGRGIMPAPTSAEQFGAVRGQLKMLLDRAEAEKFMRPVTQERSDKDKKVVETVAPETVPAKKGLWATLAGFAVTLLSAVWDTTSNYAGMAWNLFTSNKDNLPASVTDPSTLTKIFHAVPAGVWLFAVAALLGFIALKSWQSLKKTTDAVQSGER